MPIFGIDLTRHSHRSKTTPRSCVQGPVLSPAPSRILWYNIYHTYVTLILFLQDKSIDFIYEIA